IVNFRDINTTRPSYLLNFKNRGLFPITKVINNIAYKVKLPITRLYNVFYLWLLYLTDKEPAFNVKLPNKDDNTDYPIKLILDARVNIKERDPL
ncbi:hypothetical protein DM02DRAFT_532177, partial [Periconia macrospinosa]